LLLICYVIVCASLTLSEEMLCQSYLLIILIPMAVAMPPRRARGSPQAPSGDSMSPATMLAAMQAIQQELALLRQAIPIAPAGAAQGAGGGEVPGGAVPAGAVPGGGAEVPLPVSGLSLMQWMGMKLDSFDGSGTPIEAADWLTYVEDKMNVFEIAYGDRVRFGTQLLKGEAQIWWRGVQAAHSSSPGVLSWDVFIRQFVSHPGFRGPKPERKIITRCAGTKSHTYDESWHRIECHLFTI
jgi:hypothetical protein